MWNTVLLDIDCNETINFGPRFESTDPSSRYEIQTLATVSSGSKTSSIPQIFTCSKKNVLVIGIDHCVYVFTDEFKCLSMSLQHESVIDCVALSDATELLVIGEQNGVLHSLYLPQKKHITKFKLFSSNNGTCCFSSIEFFTYKGKTILAILSTLGQLLLLEIDLVSINKASSLDQWSSVEQLLTEGKQQKVDLHYLFSGINTAKLLISPSESQDGKLSFFRPKEHSLMIGLNDEEIETILHMFPEPGVQIVKAEYSSDGIYIFILDNFHQLHVVSSITCLLVMSWCEEIVLDFTSVGASAEESEIPKCMLVLQVASKEEKSCQLQLRFFPSFELHYSVLLSLNTWIIRTNDQDNVLVLEHCNACDKNSEATLRLRSITQTDPETKFAKLLRKGKFTEAENFAKLFNLDLEEVYKAQVSKALRDLSIWEKNTTNDDVHTLLGLLKNIKDTEYKICCCLRAALPSSSDTSMLLHFARQEALKSNLPNKSNLLEKITVLLHRLDTFLLLFPEEHIWPKWFEFSSTNFAKIFLKFLQISQIDKAFLFWKEHQDELFGSAVFHAKDVEEMLQYFPESIPSEHLISFLEDVLLNIIIHSLETVDVLADWIMKRCQLLEITEVAAWPSNGLKLLKVLPEACERASKLVESGGVLVSAELNLDALQRKFHSMCPKYHLLLAMIDDQKQLQILKEDYNCVISLADFREEDKVHVVFHLLDNLAGTDKLEKAVNCFFKDYTSQQNLNISSVFALYIEDVLHAYQVDWRRIWEEEVLWEQRVLDVLQHIVDQDYRMQAILKIVSESPLPWSQTIHDIVNQQLQTDHEMNPELQNQVKLSHFKALLMKYNKQGVKDAVISQPRFVMLFVRYILNQDLPSALEDALQVAHTFELFVSEFEIQFDYLVALLTKLNDHKFLEEFKKLKTENMLVIGERIIRYTIQMLDHASDEILKVQEKQLHVLLQSVISMYNYLENNFKGKLWHQIEDIRCLTISKGFQTKFNLFIRPREVSNVEMRWKVFTDYLDHLTGKKTDFQAVCMDGKKDGFISTTNDLFSIADILGLPTAEAQGRIATSFLDTGKTDGALDICREIDEAVQTLDPESLQSLVFFLIRNLEHLSQKHAGILNVVRRLCCNLLLTCSGDKLEECIKLSQWGKQLSQLASLDTQALPSGTLNRLDYYHHWHFSPFYKEHGLRLCMGPLIALLSSYVQAGEKLDSVECNQDFYDLSRDVVQQLRSSGHNSVCLDFLLHIDEVIGLSQTNTNLIPAEVISYQKKVVMDLSTSLINQIGSQRRQDLIFALGLTCLQDRDTVQQFFMNLSQLCKNDNKRLMYISKLGIRYGDMYNQPKIASNCRTLLLTTSWISRLAKLHVTIKDPSFLTPKTSAKILDDLYPVANLDVITKFCTDYNLDRNQALLSYMENLFNRQQVKYWGSSSTVPSEADLNELDVCLAKAETCVEELRENPDLRRMLYLFHHQANPYCYEVIEWLLNQLALIESDREASRYEEPFEVQTYLDILKFLKVYKRLGEPMDFEINYWMYRGSEIDHMPEISSSRLPYHLVTGIADNSTEEKSKIIAQEVYKSNLKLWMSVATLLQLNPNTLLVTAVQNEVQAWLKQLLKIKGQKGNNTQKLSHGHLNNSLLKTLTSLVQQIQDMDMAISCAFWIVRRLPNGPNKVAAAELSVKLSSYWISKNPTSIKAKESLKNFQDIYCKTAVEQKLVQYSMLCQETLALIEKPAELVLHLLEKTRTNGSFDAENRNTFAAVKEIANIAELDLKEIYHGLLESWLLAGDNSLIDEDDATMTVSHYSLKALSNSSDFEKMSENLKRSVMLLSEMLEEEFFVEEVNLLLKSMEEKGSSAGFAQVLRCLLAVVDHETLISLNESIDLEQLHEGLPKTVYLARLETLNVPCTPQMFDQCQKADLVANVLHLHSQNPKALMLCCSLCNEYHIWDEDVWNIILRNLTHMKLTENLACVLWQLNSASCLWSSSAFIQAWQCFLVGRIQSVGSCNDFRNLMVQVYLIFFSCPCRQQLDFAVLAEEFESRGHTLLSLCCVLCRSKTEDPKQQSAQNLLKRYSAESLREQLSLIVDTLPAHRTFAFAKVEHFLNSLKV